MTAMDPARLLPSGRSGDGRQLVEAQVHFQNALWMALLRPWPRADFWEQFWRTLFPQWPPEKTWPAPQLEFFTVGLRVTPDVSVMAVRVLLGNDSPHPAAVRIYTPPDRYNELVRRRSRLVEPLSDYGTAWSWRTKHEPFPGPIEPDEIFAPTRSNPMLSPVAHVLAALQPSEAEFAAHRAHWATYPGNQALPPPLGHRLGVTPLLSRTDEFDDEDDGDDDGLESQGSQAAEVGRETRAARLHLRSTPSVSVRLAPHERIADTQIGLAAPSVSAPAVGAAGNLTAADGLWETLRSALESALRRDQDLVGAVADQLVGLRRQVDIHFDIQCQVPSAATGWKRDEAVRWARQLAKRHDEHESILPLLRLAQNQTPGNLSYDDRLAIEAVVKKAYALATRDLPQCEAWVTGRLEMPQLLCAALNRGDHPWLPTISDRRRCPRCGKEEPVTDDTEVVPSRAESPEMGAGTTGMEASTDSTTGAHGAAGATQAGFTDDEDWLR